MHRTQLERLTEIVLGDAVLTLLDSEIRIGVITLRAQLNAMITAEPDAERQEAIRMALAEMQKEFQSALVN